MAGQEPINEYDRRQGVPHGARGYPRISSNRGCVVASSSPGIFDYFTCCDAASSPFHFHSKPGELVGFHAPASLLAKMRCFMNCVRTDPAATDDELLRRSKGQIAAWETERRRFSGLANLPGALLLQTVGRTSNLIFIHFANLFQALPRRWRPRLRRDHLCSASARSGGTVSSG